MYSATLNWTRPLGMQNVWASVRTLEGVRRCDWCGAQVFAEVEKWASGPQVKACFRDRERGGTDGFATQTPSVHVRG